MNVSVPTTIPLVSLELQRKNCEIVKKGQVYHDFLDHVYFSPLSVDSRSIVGRQSTDPSTDCRPTIDRLSTDCRPTVDRLSADSRPTVDRQSTDSRPTVDRQSVDVSTDSRPIYSHRQSTDGRPTVGAEDDCRSPVGRLSADCRPTACQ